jgi:hypothetical protein
MKKKTGPFQEKSAYETPRVLASYEKEELEDVIGIDPEVEGQSGGGCGCGGDSILTN